LELRRVRS